MERTVEKELERITSLGRWPRILSDKIEYAKLGICYQLEMNDAACCQEVLEAYFTNHKNRINQKKIEMKSLQPKTENYLLKKNSVLHLRSKNMHVTNGNITDELAEALLKENPKRINNFEKAPEGILDILFPPVKTKKSKDKAIQALEDDAAGNDEQPWDFEIEKKSPKQLKDFAKENGLPEKEWKNLGYDKIIAYLKKKFN